MRHLIGKTFPKDDALFRTLDDVNVQYAVTAILVGPTKWVSFYVEVKSRTFLEFYIETSEDQSFKKMWSKF